jgi:hypothetical protein
MQLTVTSWLFSGPYFVKKHHLMWKSRLSVHKFVTQYQHPYGFPEFHEFCYGNSFKKLSNKFDFRKIRLLLSYYAKGNISTHTFHIWQISVKFSVQGLHVTSLIKCHKNQCSKSPTLPKGVKNIVMFAAFSSDLDKPRGRRYLQEFTEWFAAVRIQSSTQLFNTANRNS